MPHGFLRYQSPVPDATGIHPGIFALANRLAKQGHLSPEDLVSLRSANAYYDAAYPTPDRTVYDPVANPGAQAWFKPTAQHLLARVGFYVDLLRRHDVDCRLFHSDDPGRVIYEDDVQIVVVPQAGPLLTAENLCPGDPPSYDEA